MERFRVPRAEAVVLELQLPSGQWVDLVFSPVRLGDVEGIYAAEGRVGRLVATVVASLGVAHPEFASLEWVEENLSMDQLSLIDEAIGGLYPNVPAADAP